MPDPVRQQAERELARLERMGDSNAESSMIRTYIDWLLAIPWSKRSEERLEPVHAREVLDADHEGLDDVKRRITEYLAVRKLRSDRGMVDNRRSGVILTLIGPPGTGKTSIGESIARATGRQFVRMSLGGVRDEAEIRGHRRTYIGALPGRLVRALRDAGTMNPVIMLDEVDKLVRTGAAIRRRRCSKCSTQRRITRSGITISTSSWICRTCCLSRRRTWPIPFHRRCSTAWK
jgi:ATP-dependent Lon protease